MDRRIFYVHVLNFKFSYRVIFCKILLTGTCKFKQASCDRLFFIVLLNMWQNCFWISIYSRQIDSI